MIAGAPAVFFLASNLCAKRLAGQFFARFKEFNGDFDMPTKIMPCTCKHGFQDATYGHKMRVFNKIVKPRVGWRCTVCGYTELEKEAPNAK